MKPTVTTEMVEAGTKAWEDALEKPPYPSEGEVLCRIFKAMYRLLPEGKDKP